MYSILKFIYPSSFDVSDKHKWGYFCEENNNSSGNAYNIKRYFSEGNFLKYFLYRIKYLSVIFPLRLLLHFIILSGFLGGFNYENGGNLLLFYLLMILVENFWWGVCEKLRLKVRFLHFNNINSNIQAEIFKFIIGGIIISAVFSISYILAEVNHGDVYFDSVLVGVAFFVSLSLRMINTTLFSSVNSLKRVYIPIKIIILMEVLPFIIIWYLKLFDGDFAYFLILSSLTNFLFNYHYLIKSKFRYIFLEKDLFAGWLKITPRFSITKFFENIKEHIGIGVCALALNANSFPFIFSYHLGVEKEAMQMFLIFSICFLYCTRWFRVFYFDFCDERISYIKGLKFSLLVKMLFIAPIVSLIFMSLGYGFAYFLFDISVDDILVFELLLLSVSISITSVLRFMAFVHQRYGLVFFSLLLEVFVFAVLYKYSELSVIISFAICSMSVAILIMAVFMIDRIEAKKYFSKFPIQIDIWREIFPSIRVKNYKFIIMRFNRYTPKREMRDLVSNLYSIMDVCYISEFKNSKIYVVTQDRSITKDKILKISNAYNVKFRGF